MIKINEVYNDYCINIMKQIDDCFIDTIITDPPYGLKFKNKKWDYSLPDKNDFIEMHRILKPGGLLVCFGGTRTFHRLACLMEDSGFFINDTISWLYTSGFPKSVDISYTIDKKNNKFGKIKQEFTVGNPMEKTKVKKNIKITDPNNEDSLKWYGWGTALKPSWEPIIIASKHIEGNYEDNALKYNVAGFNIDSCRIKSNDRHFGIKRTSEGRWPANVIIDNITGNIISQKNNTDIFKFYYSPKPAIKEKQEYNNHPTVKPLNLMEYLTKLTSTPYGGIVLDPYAGSGTTIKACQNIGRDFIGIESEKEYFDIIKKRCMDE